MRTLAATCGLLTLMAAMVSGALCAPGVPRAGEPAPLVVADSPPADASCAAASCCGRRGAACALFAPGTPWDVVHRVNQAMLASAPSERYDLWSTAWFGTQGAGIGGTLTYSFVPDGVHIGAAFTGDSAGPNTLHATMNAQFADEGGAPFWKNIFRQVFDRWSEITGINYVEVSDDGASWGFSGSANRGDIRIALRNIDGPSNILAFNFFPTNGDMVLDASENWANAFNDYLYLRNTLSHEHGHGLGLEHVCPIDVSKLMEPFLNLFFDGPQHDDIRGAQNLYGDRHEPNPSISTASPLGAVAQGTTLTVEELSLRNSSDVDFYSFNAAFNSRVTITATPVGFTYPQAPMSGQSCGPGAAFNSLNLLNMQMSLFGPGQNLLTTVNNTSAGNPESIVNFTLPGPGTHYIRISSAQSSPNQSQSYSLSITVNRIPTQPCPSDLNGDGVVNASDLGILLTQWNGVGGVADINQDGVVNTSDLGRLLGAWGLCL